jgi:hypothetical protein
MLFGKVRGRQPEKIHLSPELSHFLRELAESRGDLNGEQTLVTYTGLAAINTGLPHPTGQAAVTKPKLLSADMAGKPHIQAEIHGLHHLQRHEQAPEIWRNLSAIDSLVVRA